MQFYRNIALTPAVAAAQEARGSRAFARAPEGPPPDRIGDDEAAFIAGRDSFYIASVNADGWPYIQHRGGPRGFVKVLGPTTLGFADYAGNRQYLTLGNLASDERVALFFMDYARQTRLKAFARCRFVEASGAGELLDAVRDPAYAAKVERVVLFDVEAFAWNCQQHITPRYDAGDVAAIVQPLRERIAALEAELAATRGAAG